MQRRNFAIFLINALEEEETFMHVTFANIGLERRLQKLSLLQHK